jgi:hypothetical protein
MNDLVEFQRLRIIALQEKLTEYEQYIFELADKDCPDDYKRIVKQEIINN